jgi:hypothetical protein
MTARNVDSFDIAPTLSRQFRQFNAKTSALVRVFSSSSTDSRRWQAGCSSQVR